MGTNNNKPLWFLGASIVLVVVFAVWGTFSNNVTESEDIIVEGAIATYYYGRECPHCTEVDQFLEENKIAEKVAFSKKEVWHNTKNNDEMVNRSGSCGIDKEKIGVPFLYDEKEQKCYSGTPDVEGYFKRAAGIP